MKNVTHVLFKTCLVALLLAGLTSHSQCPLGVLNGTGATYNGSNWVTYTNYSPGTYFNMPVLSGGSYGISTCGASYDTQITGRNNTGSIILFYNDQSGPLCSGNPASVDNYVPNFSDYIKVSVNLYNCLPGGSNSINVAIRQNNNLAITSSTAAMCPGQTRSLTATPAAVTVVPGGYGDKGTFYGNGVSSGVFTAPSVTATTVFTITYTFGYVSKTQLITVHPKPSLSIVSTKSVLCIGESANLVATGAVSYTWVNEASTQQAITISPTVTTLYNIIGKSANNCTNTATYSQKVDECLGLASTFEPDRIFNVHPNPNAGEFTMQSVVDMNVSIYNELGQKLNTVSLNESNDRVLAVRDLSDGVYFIVCRTDIATFKRKVVVIH